MSVTDLQPYFTQIIGYNSMNVHRIPTNLGTEIGLNEPIKYTKFQPNWSTHSCFIADFAKCAKRRGRSSRNKNKEKIPDFGCLYRGNGWSDFLQIWNVDSPT